MPFIPPYPIFNIDQIQGSECIGDSRTKINTNFVNLSTSANFAASKVAELSGKWAESTSYSPNETSGYIVLASGLIIQWGKVNAVSTDAMYEVIFPYSGMTKVFSIVTSHVIQTPNVGTSSGPCSIKSDYTTQKFTLIQDSNNGASGVSEMWMAVGA